jgi:hypothetical protein
MPSGRFPELEQLEQSVVTHVGDGCDFVMKKIMILYPEALPNRTTGPGFFSFVSPILFDGGERTGVIKCVNDTTLRMSRRRKSPGNQKNGQSNCVTQ